MLSSQVRECKEELAERRAEKDGKAPRMDMGSYMSITETSALSSNDAASESFHISNAVVFTFFATCYARRSGQDWADAGAQPLLRGGGGWRRCRLRAS